MDLSDASLAAWRERVREETQGETAEALATATAGALRVEPLYTALDLPADAPLGVAGAPAWVRGTTSAPRLPASTPLLAGIPRGESASSLMPLRVAVDPLAALAAQGGPQPLARVRQELAAAVLRRLAEHDPAARPLEVSTAVYHEAGAAEALELGLALGATAEYLRWLEDEGIEPAAAAPRIGWSLALGRDVFLQIAKLRAARLLWSKLLAACGVDPVPAPRLRAMVSRRTWTRRDPWSNLLRGTTQVFAALAGGADEITPLPFDLLLDQPSELGARLARNTILILAEEGFVGRTLDPGGGAYAIEALTDALARRAWEELIWVEGLGGLAAALTSGALAERLERCWSEQAARFASGEEKITGLTEVRSSEEPEAARALRSGTSLPELAATPPGSGGGPRATPLPRHRDAEAFEEEA